MHARAVLALPLLFALSLTGCKTFNKMMDAQLDPTHPKRCKRTADCSLKYGVLYRGFCDAGCFGKKAETDKTCAKQGRFEPFLPGIGCACVEKVCSMDASWGKGKPK